MNLRLTVPSLDELYQAYHRLGTDPVSLSEKAKLALEINKHLRKEDYGPKLHDHFSRL